MPPPMPHTLVQFAAKWHPTKKPAEPTAPGEGGPLRRSKILHFIAKFGFGQNKTHPLTIAWKKANLASTALEEAVTQHDPSALLLVNNGSRTNTNTYTGLAFQEANPANRERLEK